MRDSLVLYGNGKVYGTSKYTIETTIDFSMGVISMEAFYERSWNRPANLYKILVTVIYSGTMLVTVTSECLVKKVICKSWTGKLVNNADRVQTPQNAASDQCLHCLLKLQEVKG